MNVRRPLGLLQARPPNLQVCGCPIEERGQRYGNELEAVGSGIGATRQGAGTIEKIALAVTPQEASLRGSTAGSCRGALSDREEVTSDELMASRVPTRTFAGSAGRCVPRSRRRSRSRAWPRGARPAAQGVGHDQPRSTGPNVVSSRRPQSDFLPGQEPHHATLLVKE